MSKDQYLRMVEQTGEEIDWDRIPPEYEDFPESIHQALNIYNSLGNRIYPDVGYIGKDFTNLDLLFNLNKIKTPSQIDWQMELLLFLDSRSVTESQKAIKNEMKKMKKG